MKKVYMDHSATTPVREEVAEAMLPYYSDTFGNASSIHVFGQKARNALENARKGIANILGADSREIIFTSGGTESDNYAIKGIAYGRQGRQKHIVTSSIEHSAILSSCQYLEQEGYEITYLPVDEHGMVNPDEVERAIRPETILVSVMLANAEVGTIQPIREIGEITRKRGIPFHTDAVQAVGKIPVRVDELNIDLLSISGHKIYGPKGIGALYVCKGTPIVPLMHGGHHEMGYRPGTENVAAIAGLAKALELAEHEREDFYIKMSNMRSMLEKGISEKIERVKINGHPEKRLPNILNASFNFIDGEALLLSLDMKGIAVSTGSACSSDSKEVSHVLTAMDISPDVARGAIRFSLGRLNDEDDISYVLETLPDIVSRLRETSPIYRFQET